MTKLLRPPLLIWLLAHIIVFLIGVVVISTGAFDRFARSAAFVTSMSC